MGSTPAASFLWFDYESFGADPRRDRPSQFACQRTSTDLQLIGEPESFLCQPPADYLPEPAACLLTGLLPQALLEIGLPEPVFAAALNARMSVPGTCNVGYNSLRFDDELSRHLYWRSFFDPYAHEWANGNSRFDLIDVLRMAYALRPDGLQWPRREDGAPSFRLEQLAHANGLTQSHAHDAADDVLALVGLARCLRRAQPRLWNHALKMRHRATVAPLLELEPEQPLLHVSQRFPAERGCLAMVWPLLRHPQMPGKVLLVDLNVAPELWADLDAEELAARWYAPRESGLERPPLKAVQTNRVPMLAPLSVLRGVDLARIRLDPQRCLENLAQLRKRADLAERVRQAWLADPKQYEPADADVALYDGFISDPDRALCQRVLAAGARELADLPFKFNDVRLQELLWRRRARWYPEGLSAAEQRRWSMEAGARLRGQVSGQRSFRDFQAALDELAVSRPEQAERLEVLAAWGKSRAELFPQ